MRTTKDNTRTTEDNTRTTEDNTRATEDNTRTTEDNTRTTEDNTRTTEDNTRTTEDNTRTTEDKREIRMRSSFQTFCLTAALTLSACGGGDGTPPEEATPATPSEEATPTVAPVPENSPTPGADTSSPSQAPTESPSPSLTPEEPPVTPDPTEAPTPAWTPPTNTPSPEIAPLITTTSGPVEGFEDSEDTMAWLGIPFAAPPVGALRWRAPQEPESWSEPYPAVALPSPCSQLEERDDDGDGENELYSLGEEDCLYLNLWRPKATPETLRPVMVWIHGGGNVQGSSSDTLYQGAHLAAQADVLLVTVQYRLNLFGYLYHEALFDGTPTTDSGNFATLDLIRALEWVRDNAEVFGGDPSRVTVFGESAGGVNTWSMMMSPLAEGLFHRAIVESGCFSSRELEEARDHAQELLELMVVADGLTTEEEAAAFLETQGTDWITDYFFDKSQADILEIFASNGGFPLSAFKPGRDGLVYRTGGTENLVQGNYNQVPMIIGANRDEQKLFYYSYAAMTELEYQVLMQLIFGDAVEEIEALYPRDAYDPETPYNQITDILDMTFEPICSEYMSWAVSPHQPTWLYHFRYDNLVAPYDYMFGAAHGLELPFVFGQLENALYPEEGLEERVVLSDAMIHYWGCFATTGDPNCTLGDPTAPTWDTVDQSSRETFRRIILDDVIRQETLPDINLERINYWIEYFDMGLEPIPLEP